MLSLLFGALVVAPVYADQQRLEGGVPPELPSDYSSEWEQALQAASRLEDAAFVFDVDTTRLPPDVPQHATGEFLCHILSEAHRREWTNINGVQLFTRYSPSTMGGFYAHKVEALSWLNSLSGDEWREMIEGTFTSGTIPDEQRDAILATFRGGQGFQSALAGNPLSSTVEAVFIPVMTVQLRDGRTVKQALWVLGEGRPARPSPAKSTTEAFFRPLPHRSEGDLDFGEGKLLTLREVLDEARRVFSSFYTYDGRLAGTTYFFSGKFDKETFDRCITRLTDLKPSQGQRRSESERFSALVQAAMQEIKHVLLDADLNPDSSWVSEVPEDERAKWSFDKVSQGFYINLDALQAISPRTASVFESFGIAPGDQVRVSLGVRLGLDTHKVAYSIIDGFRTGTMLTGNVSFR